MASLLYARPELNEQATSLKQGTRKSLKLEQSRHESNYSEYVCLNSIDWLGDYIYKNNTSIFRTDM